jgi:hypothetical protein
MMTLFYVSLAAFAVCAVTWFLVWAIWIHAQTGAYGPAPKGIAAAAIPNEPTTERRLAWYRALKWSTIVLGAVAIVSGAIAIR